MYDSYTQSMSVGQKQHSFVATRRLMVIIKYNSHRLRRGLGSCYAIDINSCHLFCSLIKESDAYYGCFVFKVPILSLTHTHKRVASHTYVYEAN